MRDIFFKVDKSFMPQLMRELALESDVIVRVDERKEAFSPRTKTDMTLEQGLAIVESPSEFNKIHWCFIYRRHIQEYLEVACCTMCRKPELFIWLEAPIDLIGKYISKFSLTQLSMP